MDVLTGSECNEHRMRKWLSLHDDEGACVHEDDIRRSELREMKIHTCTASDCNKLRIGEDKRGLV